VLTITVYDQAELSGKFNVEADGSFAYPLIGRIVAGGLTLRAVESELKRRLADGYLKNPQVSVAIEQYRSQRIFVIGEVRAPGAYQLTGDMTLIEALARAGSVTTEAGEEILIVRPPDAKSRSGPVLPSDDTSAEVIRVNARECTSSARSRRQVRLRLKRERPSSRRCRLPAGLRIVDRRDASSSFERWTGRRRNSRPS
jgi:protein involved in polysaccharide export with SLBB domain